MDMVWREFQDRVSEVEAHFSLIKSLETGDYIIVDRDKSLVPYSTKARTMQRASTYLLLYNLVECTTSRSLIEIHNRLKASKLPYEKFNKEVKQLMLNYVGNVTSKKSSTSEAAPFIHDFGEVFSGRVGFVLEYKDMEKYYSLYSGNLDSKKIKETLQKYGILFDLQQGVLQKIKDKRNKLAHGEMSFEECGRDLTIQEIRNDKDKCTKYLEEMIIAIEMFLHDRGFES